MMAQILVRVEKNVLGLRIRIHVLADSRWNVHKVIIRETEHAFFEFPFVCDAWIEPAKDGIENTKEFGCSGET
jgi:hypothetical protein